MASADGPEVLTFESRGVRCDVDCYRPSDGGSPWPAVLLAHVFGAERAWGLERFATRFATAGVAAFPFDYRHLGTSDGTPRRLVDPRGQLDDWAAALERVRALPHVDADRVALWGSSFSGGHVLETARRDPDVRAVVAQVPYVDGLATVVHQLRGRGWRVRVRDLGRVVADRLLAAVGRGPVEIAIVDEPGEGGLVDSPGARRGFLSLVPSGATVVNRTPARVILRLPGYRPGRRADAVDVPVHVVVAERDRLLPRGPTEATVERLPDARVHRVDAAHFEVHGDPWFEDVVERQVAFLRDALDVA